MARNRRSPRVEHLEVAREAGLGTVSVPSIAAGVLCAYGAFALVAAVVGAALSSLDVSTDFRTNDWTGSGAVALLASAVALLLAYLFGGYVAGRMARRAGLLHGLAVFVVSLVLGGAVGAVVGGLTDDTAIRDNLQSIGVPTTWDQVSGVAATGAIVSLAAILVGSLAGAAMGERWHTKLARRWADPTIGPAADAEAAAERARQERAAQRGDDLVEGESVHYLDLRDRDEREQGAPVDVVDLDADRADRDLADRDLAERHLTDADEPRYTAAEWEARMRSRR